MGLFGSRKKTTVGTSVARVIEDENLPDAMTNGAFRSILQNDGQMLENVMDELSESLATRIMRMYRYGRDHYIHGLPSGTSMGNLKGQDVVKAAIESQVGAGVSISYYHYGPINLIHLAWHLLVKNYGYDSSTNKLTVGGKQVYLADMQPVIVEASVQELENGSLDLWGRAPNTGIVPNQVGITAAFTRLTAPSPFLVDPNAAADYVRVKHVREVETQVVVEGVSVTRTVLEQGELSLSLTGFNVGASFHQVKYTRAGKEGYWLYQVGSNTLPQVEALFNQAPTANGTFFPFAYFRYNKQNTAANKQSAEYNSTRKLLKIINMDFEDVATAINENPDIADVEQAMLMSGVPANTSSPIEQRYLFDFFDNLYTTALTAGQSTTSSQAHDILKKFGTSVQQSTIIIQDKKFKMALSWKNIIKKRVAGGLEDDKPNEVKVIIKPETLMGKGFDDQDYAWTSEVKTHVYRHQITDTIYEEIEVVGLQMVYHIFGDYTVTADENDDILLVPLDYEVIKHYSLIDREVLAARSLHYVFNSRIVTKLKWYQTGIFKVILVIVAIIITIYTWGGGSGALAAALGSGAYGAAAVMFLQVLVKQLVVGILVKKFVQVVGARNAFLAAVLAVVATYYGGASTELVNSVLSLSTNIVKTSINAYLEDGYSNLLSEMTAWDREIKEQTATLERAQNLLTSSNRLDPLIIFGETPDEFYQRTVHSGNIGIVGIEAVSSFVDMKLMLPKLTETLGDLV